MKPTLLASVLLPAAALLLSGRPAAAQVTLDLQAPFQSGTIGSTYQFFGTITNFGPSAVYVLSDNYTPDPLPVGVTLDDSPLASVSLLSAGGTAGSSYTGDIFDVTLAPTAAPGFYSGFFSLAGGADPVADYYTTLNMNEFAIAAVPEASTTVSFGVLLALGGLTCIARRKKIGSAG